jgi:4-amino-4-deoxychorismate lyase
LLGSTDAGGIPDDLQLPLSDRGLQLADGLFETILILNGAAQLLPEHLARWVASAELLGMDPPPSQQDLSGLIDEAIVKSELASGQWSPAVELEPRLRAGGEALA